MSFLCQIHADGVTVGRWEIGDEPLVVGRGGYSDVAIQDERLSREHFAILREGNNFVICDLNSTNGTWVNGRRVSRFELEPNDRIRAGRAAFCFEEGLASAECAWGNCRHHATELML